MNTKKKFIFASILLASLLLIVLGGYKGYIYYSYIENKVQDLRKEHNDTKKDLSTLTKELESKNTQLKSLTTQLRDIQIENQELEKNQDSSICISTGLNLSVRIPKGWTCESSVQESYDDNSESYYFLNINAGLYKIQIEKVLGRGDGCGFDVGAKPSNKCYRQAFFKTSNWDVTAYLSSGQYFEMIGRFESNDQSIDTLVYFDSGNRALTLTQKNQLIEFFKSYSWIK